MEYKKGHRVRDIESGRIGRIEYPANETIHPMDDAYGITWYEADGKYSDFELPVPSDRIELLPPTDEAEAAAAYARKVIDDLNNPAPTNILVSGFNREQRDEANSAAPCPRWPAKDVQGTEMIAKIIEGTCGGPWDSGGWMLSMNELAYELGYVLSRLEFSLEDNDTLYVHGDATDLVNFTFQLGRVRDDYNPLHFVNEYDLIPGDGTQNEAYMLRLWWD